MGHSLGVLGAAAALTCCGLPALAQPCPCAPGVSLYDQAAYQYRGGEGLGRFEVDYAPPQPPAPGYAYDDDGTYRRRDQAYAAGAAEARDCPVRPGERLIACRYVPFASPSPEQGVAVSEGAFVGGADADYAYGYANGGGGGGYRMSSAGAIATSSASATASAYSSSQVSVDVSVHDQYQRRGGYGGIPGFSGGVGGCPPRHGGGRVGFSGGARRR